MLVICTTLKLRTYVPQDSMKWSKSASHRVKTSGNIQPTKPLYLENRHIVKKGYSSGQ